MSTYVAMSSSHDIATRHHASQPNHCASESRTTNRKCREYVSGHSFGRSPRKCNIVTQTGQEDARHASRFGRLAGRFTYKTTRHGRVATMRRWIALLPECGHHSWLRHPSSKPLGWRAGWPGKLRASVSASFPRRDKLRSCRQVPAVSLDEAGLPTLIASLAKSGGDSAPQEESEGIRYS